MDLAQLVLDDEMAAMIRRTMEGIPVNDQTLMTDVTHALGSWGDYLSSDATIAHARSFTVSDIFERRVYDSWEAEGRVDAYERARRKAKAILQEHEVEPLDKDVQKEIDAILAEAERKLQSGALV
jgi:trimethylamine--corrinoid protein Co-methyltransferase